jgi:spore germination protein YaaH
MEGVEGVNVISPTWFFLSDNEGNLVSLASASYVEAAHARGIEVWGLVENMSYENDTSEVLSNMVSRENLVAQLIAHAQEYQLDGINVDFEELGADAAEGYIQFIRELSIQCRANQIVLSVDNYVPTASSSHYNRKEQGIVADYVVIMGYDEHYGGSTEAGSTASIGFVEEGIVNTLKEVPAEKVINAIPFYTRIFIQTPESVASKEDGGVLVEDRESEFERYLLTSTAVSMARAEQLLREYGVTPDWDDVLGQYYGEYKTGGRKYLVWLEEEKSIGLKMELIREYQLAGVAEWSLGLAKGTVWGVIESYLE